MIYDTEIILYALCNLYFLEKKERKKYYGLCVLSHNTVSLVWEFGSVEAHFNLVMVPSY